MDEIFTSLIMGEIHNEDILIKELSYDKMLFISRQNLGDVENIVLKLYKLETSSYEQFYFVNCNIHKISVEKTHNVFSAEFVFKCDRFISALSNLKQFIIMHNKIRSGNYEGLSFLKDKKPIYPIAQDDNISNFKEVLGNWFDFAINEHKNMEFSNISEHIEIAFALNTYNLMQKCNETTYTNIYYETLEKYNLSNHGLLKQGFQRVYIGNEFCQYIFPYNQILKYIKKAHNENYEVTIMLSFMNENMSKKILRTINDIEQYCFQNQKKVEVVVNDWGILNYIKSNTSMMIPILGRLLNKRKKDPRRKWIWRNQSDETIQFNCLSNNDYFRQFLTDYNVERYEFEVYEDMQRTISLKLKGNKNSLHFPFYQMMTSLSCPLFNEYNHFKQDKLQEHNCPYICAEIIRIYSRDLHMVGIGNSNFAFVGDVLTDPDILTNYCKNGIDRLVFSPII